ncbi:MAG TPA: twin-arginine translocation signal domain-containing protein [Pyrinomonadaceae bacterium]|nr:twin-arginine translocation signal domain-containing protein [Pyrinomonadaceae bacterium]
MFTQLARRRFLKDSAAILGSAAVTGSLVQLTYALPDSNNQEKATAKATVAAPAPMKADLPDAMVKIKDKNHYVAVQAWISPNVVQMTGADTDSKRQALVSRLLHGHEKYLDVITKGGEHVGELRFYIDVPHEVEAASLHEDTETHQMASSASGASKCVTNYICCTWKDGKTECCAKWQCCGL